MECNYSHVHLLRTCTHTDVHEDTCGLCQSQHTRDTRTREAGQPSCVNAGTGIHTTRD